MNPQPLAISEHRPLTPAAGVCRTQALHRRLHPGLALIPLLTALLSWPVLAGGTASTIEVAINGMVCSFCAQGIERKLRSLPATESVKVDLDQKLVNITLRPGGSISNDQLQRLIRDSGFDVRQIQRTPATP